MTKLKIFLLYIGVIIVTLVSIFFFYNAPSSIEPIKDDSGLTYEFIHGQIKDILSVDKDTGDKTYAVSMLSGKESGKTLPVVLSAVNEFNTYKSGDIVSVYKYTNSKTNEVNYAIADFYRQGGLLKIFIIFCLITLLIAGKKGMTAILSVLLSIVLYYFMIIDPIKNGFSPIFLSFFFTIIITFLTVPIIHGFNKKALSAMIAIVVGFVFSFGITYLFKNLSFLGSTPAEEFRTLKAIYPSINIGDVLIASLFLGATGALIDTAISVSSAIFEALHDSKKTFAQVYEIGMNVGKDVLASMTNTLLFAYLASTLPFLILLGTSSKDISGDLLNMDFVTLELVRTFIGGLSLVLVIPLVSVLSAYFLIRKRA